MISSLINKFINLVIKDNMADEFKIHKEIMQDIEDSNIVVLQMVDYNVVRWEYGFSDYFLENDHILSH